MCRVCNEALATASQSALNLANAAVALDGINQNAASQILADAAAALFKPAEEDKVEPVKANGGAGTPESSAASNPFTPINNTLPAGVYIDRDGVLYINGEAAGIAQLVKRS